MLAELAHCISALQKSFCLSCWDFVHHASWTTTKARLQEGTELYSKAGDDILLLSLGPWKVEGYFMCGSCEMMGGGCKDR